MSLSEFMNAYYGFMDNQQFEQRQAWERSRFVLSGLVKDPPSFPWEEGEHKPYSDEELQEIIAYHDNVVDRAEKSGSIVKLTENGPVDVSSGS